MTRRQIAWILILIVDVGYLVWGALAAASPTGLARPGGRGILPAGYEGFSGGSWAELVRTSPMTAVTAISGARASGYPRIAFDRDEVVFAWTENEAGQSVVKTAAAKLAAVAGSAR